MSVTLSFFRKDTYTEPRSVDPRRTSESDLRFDVFLGDVELIIDGCRFAADWGWVPILDFADGMAWISNQLGQGQNAKFDFTESEGEIVFALVPAAAPPEVRVSATFSDCESTCGLSDLQDCVRGFVRRVILAVEGADLLVEVSPAFAALKARMLALAGDDEGS